MGDEARGQAEAPVGQIARAFAVLEVVADHGTCTAQEISHATGIPLPTVYRLAHELMRMDCLVHLQDRNRFALGYQLHRLAVGLHNDLAVPASVRREIASMRDDLSMASYLALHRGADFVVVFVADSPQCPRLQPMDFGFHRFPHATAFGKLGLSQLDAAARETRLAGLQPTPLTGNTIVDPEELRLELQRIADDGVAWEHGEFQEGTTCLAVPIRFADGRFVGSVAVSMPSATAAGRRRHIEERVRVCAARSARAYLAS